MVYTILQNLSIKTKTVKAKHNNKMGYRDESKRIISRKK